MRSNLLKGVLVTLSATVLVVSLLSVGVRAASPQRVALPNLPTAHDLYPEKFDENGCRIVPSDEGGGLRCPKKEAPDKATDKAAAKEQDAPKSRMLLGFRGPHYSSYVNNSGVEILSDTVTTTTQGNWQAYGLVRNDLDHSVGNVVVNASLIGTDGTILARAAALVPIDNLRPGEPAPFSITSQIAAADVVTVNWSATWGVANGDTSRDLVFQSYYALPYGESLDEGVPRDDPPYPYVLASGIHNVGRTVHSATLFVAWLDAQGKVVKLDSASLFGATSDSLAVHKGASANFEKLRVNDPQIGPRIGKDLTSMYWVVGK